MTINVQGLLITVILVFLAVYLWQTIRTRQV